MSSVVVIGVGNPDRGDDGAGREVARLLQAGGLAARIVEADGEASTLLAHLEGATAAYLIDACVSGAPAGAVRRIDLSTQTLPAARFGLSSHGFGLAEALELAKALEQLPPLCVVYAIEAESFEIGASLSDPVARSVRNVVEAVRRDIAAL
jgi:hydrogenase maturation protease